MLPAAGMTNPYSLPLRYTQLTKTRVTDTNLNLPNSSSPGTELPSGMAVPAEVEDRYPGLHPVSPRRQHAQEEPGGVQYAGG